MSKDDDRILNRRGFFRRAFRELLTPVADALEEKAAEVGRHFAPLASAAAKDADVAPVPATPKRALPVLLRPPGALPEPDFLSLCSRCGACAKACPVEAIRLDPDGLIAGGAPFINPNVSPCVASAGMECMEVCPTGALLVTPLALVDMGTARWDSTTCLRTRPGASEPTASCRQCVDDCPVGEVAIKLNGNSVLVLDDGCIGCGVCQHRCPTSPKSIVIEPRDPPIAQ